TVSVSAFNTASSKSLTFSGCGTSAAFVVGTPPSDLIFSDKYKACPSSSVISSSKKGFNAGRYTPVTADALYVYGIAAPYSCDKSTISPSISSSLDIIIPSLLYISFNYIPYILHNKQKFIPIGKESLDRK